MAIWYALICLTDIFDANGKLDYPAGAVKSFGTVLSGDTAQLLAKGIEAVDIGEYPDQGPDFRTERFDVGLKMMVPFTPPQDTADQLLAKSSWDSADTEEALRTILKGMTGKG
jgi:hypothetical protein